MKYITFFSTALVAISMVFFGTMGNVSAQTVQPEQVACHFLSDYLKYGEENDVVQVTLVFDQKTFEAVKLFQQKYSDDVLGVWGLSSEDATGYVYITTKNKIN